MIAGIAQRRSLTPVQKRAEIANDGKIFLVVLRQNHIAD
jgi:hypothetical protein